MGLIGSDSRWVSEEYLSEQIPDTCIKLITCISCGHPSRGPNQLAAMRCCGCTVDFL